MPAAVLPVDLGAAATARALLRDTLAGRDGSGCDDALIMISEVVTNAVRHTRDVLQLLIVVTGQSLRVEVTDDNPVVPTVPPVDLDGTGGRGLFIVDRLADCWGVTPTASGKTVWFEISLDRAELPPTPEVEPGYQHLPARDDRPT